MVPFCDEVVMQLNNTENSKLSIRGLLRLVPPLLVKCEDGNLKNVVNDLKLYEAELPLFESLYLELQLWRDRWLRCSTKIPDTLCGANCEYVLLMNRSFSLCLPIFNSEQQK